MDVNDKEEKYFYYAIKIDGSFIVNYQTILCIVLAIANVIISNEDIEYTLFAFVK